MLNPDLKIIFFDKTQKYFDDRASVGKRGGLGSHENRNDVFIKKFLVTSKRFQTINESVEKKMRSKIKFQRMFFCF